MSRPAAAIAWGLCALFAGGLALITLVHWSQAFASGLPVLYGEGAVANAAILLRDGSPYRDLTGAVAANYPPEYLALASVGDPLRTGRAISIASALAIAAAVWWRAGGGGSAVRLALGLAWLALPTVALWGAGVKPDLVAVVATFFGVTLLDGSPRGRRAAAAGALFSVAVWAKPTALLPVAAVLIWIALRERPAVRPALLGAAAFSVLELLWILALGLPDVWTHVVVWNALPWSAEQVVLLVILGAVTLGLAVAITAIERAAHGIGLAYLLGAVAVVVLGGRQGASINYLLDLSAAIVYVLATAAPRLRLSPAPAVALGLQLAIGLGLVDPFATVGQRVLKTGGWGEPGRAEVVRALGPGEHLVEDSGLLVATGGRPPIDDLFLWGQLARIGLIDATPTLDRVRRGELASIVAEVDLARIDEGPAYERARWHPDLIGAVLERYALERSANGLWVYRPRPR